MDTRGGRAVLKLARRYLVVAALMFWQGGFTFYSAVVIHIGADVFASHRPQGFVTRRVTNYLNLAGGVALAVLVWDVAASTAPRWRRWSRAAVWAFLVVSLGLLLWMHERVDAYLDPVGFVVHEHAVFKEEHSRYLMVSTAQWAAGLVLLALTLWDWRTEDATDAQRVSASE
jgi:hypothetical protein